MSQQVVSESRVIAASPESIFDLLADPSKHPLIDGSGSVRAARPGGPARLSLGAEFGMDMRVGVPYKMTNTVVEFEENRRIGWCHLGGHVWRYELEAVEGGTKVTESFDMTTAKSPAMLRLMRAPQRNREAIRKTLARLAEVVGRASDQR